ncbi:MAG: hypothetical protein LBM00_04225 [Deltaproteobacteria bacterium]|jgi:hypothetical protein|nr:hypothetical protein [Deltaproteobacteria bacterium]
MRIYISRLAAYFVALSFLCSLTANAAQSSRIDCGAYSFISPDGFAFNHIDENSANFSRELLLSLPSGKNAEPALIICMREKKADYYDFVLSRKQKIKIQGGNLPPAELNIEATENLTRGNIPLRFSILEEKITSRREARGIYYYIPVLEIAALDDEHHTLIFINELRKEGEFFDMEEYKSSANKAALTVLRSIRRKSP